MSSALPSRNVVSLFMVLQGARINGRHRRSINVHGGLDQITVPNTFFELGKIRIVCGPRDPVR